MFKSFTTQASAALAGAATAVSVAANQVADFVEPTLAPRPMESNPDWAPRHGSVLHALFNSLPVSTAAATPAQDMGSFMAAGGAK
jgi:hypothetical protein